MDFDLKIRKYKKGDFVQINSIWKEIGLGGSQRGDNEEVIEKTIENGGFFVILENVNNNEIIGTSWLTNDYRRLYLHHFGIKKEFQGKGFAKKLLIETLKIVKKNGLQVKLEVHKDNLKAINLYKNSGFQYLGDYQVLIIRDLLTI